MEFCKSKEIILDEFLRSNLSNLNKKESIQVFLSKLKLFFARNFITINLVKKNPDKLNKILAEIKLIDESDYNYLKNLFSFEDKSAEINEVEIVGEENSKVKVVESKSFEGKKVEVKDFITYFRNRYEDMKNIMADKKELDDLISIGKLSEEKQKFSVIGMVSSKRTSKNNNIMIEIEDLTGKMKVIVSADKEDLVEACEDITLDSVIGFKGFGSSEIMFVNEIVFPDIRLEEKKNSPVEEYVVFIGDIHLGSKNFLEKDFEKFINFLNDSENKEFDVGKIKYLIIVGDLVTGIGNYPNQEEDLVIKDLEEQFEKMASYLSRVRKDITVVISPGNHDGVRLIEPQPLLDEKYAWPLYELENVVMVGNPARVNVAQRKGFPGFDILLYHGFSFPYYANNIQKLMKEKTMNQPEKIMKYLLKNRHLSPTHGSNQYFPLEKDPLLIRKAPDIFFSGHTHKSGVTYYNNILVVSSSSWEGMTPYQEKFGNEPDHCKVPVFNLKTRAVKILDFESDEDGVKTFKEEEK